MFRIAVCILVSLVSVAAEAKTRACNVNGYSIDKDPNGLNVRSGPGGGHAVITSLRRAENGWPHLHITGASGNWLRIDTAIEGMDPDGNALFRGVGWVHNSLVATASKGYETGSIPLHARPDPASAASGRVPREEDIRILSCSGQWIYGGFRNRRGWVAPNDHCPTPETTCN